MRVYFAHPCFTDREKKFKDEFLDKIRKRLAQDEKEKIITIVDPFLGTPNVENDRNKKLIMSGEIKKACIDMLESCDVIIAVTDDDDTGVAFEAGYGHCINKPIVLISRDTCDKANAMLIGAAKARIDNVLTNEGIENLCRTINWFLVASRRFPAKPGVN